MQVCSSSSDGDVMTCLTPDLSSVSNTTDAVDWPIVAGVSFVMDAVGGLAATSSPLVTYFDDPLVYRFHGSDRLRYFYDDDTYLEIEVCFVAC